jgi:hypothetical protein
VRLWELKSLSFYMRMDAHMRIYIRILGAIFEYVFEYMMEYSNIDKVVFEYLT